MTVPADDYLGRSLQEFLDAVAAVEPAPGGGAVCAVSVAMAAGLAAMAAGFSRGHWADAEEVGRAAEEIRARVAPLAAADAAAYRQVLAALARPMADPDRAAAVRSALSHAADVPLAVAEAGAEVVALAARLQRHGNPNLRGDAVTARQVAGAAVRSAGGLVALNLRDADDPRRQRAEQLARSS